MSSRKEKTARLKASKKAKTIAITASIVVMAVVLAALSIVLAPKRDITLIEGKVPAYASAMLVSEANEEAWEYMNAIAGFNFEYPSKADHVAYTMINRNPVLYFSIDPKDQQEAEQELKDGIVGYKYKDGVFAITLEDELLSDESLGSNPDYRKKAVKGNNQSFGYIDFASLGQGNNDVLSKIFPSAGKWYGEYHAGSWTGTLEGIDYSKVNEVDASSEKFSNPKFGNFVDSFKTGDTEEKTSQKTFSIGLLNELLEKPYTSGMNNVVFEIKGERLTFSLK